MDLDEALNIYYKGYKNFDEIYQKQKDGTRFLLKFFYAFTIETEKIESGYRVKKRDVETKLMNSKNLVAMITPFGEDWDLEYFKTKYPATLKVYIKMDSHDTDFIFLKVNEVKENPIEVFKKLKNDDKEATIESLINEKYLTYQAVSAKRTRLPNESLAYIIKWHLNYFLEGKTKAITFWNDRRDIEEAIFDDLLKKVKP